MSIVLYGIASEQPLAYVAESARKLGIDCITLNQRAFEYDDIELWFDNGRCTGRLQSAMQVYNVDEVSGIYSRAMSPVDLPECQSTKTTSAENFSLQRASAWYAAFESWMEAGDLRVANRPSAGMSNFSKPYQCQLINQAGLDTPETLVSNDPDAIRAFRARCGKVIYKSTSGIRSIVKMLDDAAMANLHKVRALPTQFQQFVSGDNVRVHVVGSSVFAARIESDAIDYRYASQEGCSVQMSAWHLPEGIASACVTLAQNLGLSLCGIDFKLTPQGQFVCFEVNTSPAYSYYQDETGLAISDALAKYLAGIPVT